MHSEYIRECNSRTAILFIHGILGTPRHFDEFITLVPDEWSIYNILLDGHGGKVEDLSRTSMNRWKTQINKITAELCRKYENIIIIAHSMGTLFAAEQALRHPQIKLLCFLMVPLAIALKPSAVTNSLKVIFNKIRPNDIRAAAARQKYSIAADKRLWKYLGWLPRYIELFRLSAKSRAVFRKLNTPCFVFQSAQDELVSLKSCQYLKQCHSARIKILPNSGHFYYHSEDNSTMLKYCSKLINTAVKKFA